MIFSQLRTCRHRATAEGRDYRFAVNADSRHTIRLRLNGRSLRPRTHDADPYAQDATMCSWSGAEGDPQGAARLVTG